MMTNIFGGLSVLVSAFCLLQSAFQILIVLSSGLIKKQTKNKQNSPFSFPKGINCTESLALTVLYKKRKMYNMFPWYFIIVLDGIALQDT